MTTQKYMIKAIIFDAGDVVYYRDKETLKPILDFLKKNDFDISAEQFLKAYDEHILEAYKGNISKDEHVKKILEFFKIKFDDKFFNKYTKVFRRNFGYTKIKKNIHSVFKKIKSLGIKICILTDTLTTEESKWKWFKKIDVAQFIDAIICSSATGHTKDEKEAYIIALKKLNVKSNEAIFVGHKKYEMKGAKLAGIKSVSIEKNAKGDYYVDDISKILNIIKNLNLKT